MFFQNLPYCHADFAGKIFIETVNLSPKSKAFLKEKAHHVTTLKDLSLMSYSFLRNILQNTSKSIRTEILSFYARIKQWMATTTKGLHFSRNIPSPQKTPRGEEKSQLIALLLAEPLLGNRRKITIAKQYYLERLYREEQRVKKEFCSFRNLQRFRVAC